MLGFYLKYLVYFILGALALVGGLVAAYLTAQDAWVVIGLWLALLAWLVAFHPVAIWLLYRDTRALVIEMRGYAAKGRNLNREDLIALSSRIADTQGVPEFLARWFLNRIVRKSSAV